MASLLGTTVANNYAKHVRANGLGPRTVIVTIAKTDITDAELFAALAVLTSAGGSGSGSDTNGPDAFTVAGLAGSSAGAAFVAGTTDSVYVALQGTGTPTTGSDVGATGVTVTVIATFDQNYQ